MIYMYILVSFTTLLFLIEDLRSSKNLMSKRVGFFLLFFEFYENVYEINTIFEELRN